MKLKEPYIVAVDFDGTLAKHVTPFDPKLAGKPIPKMLFRVKKFIKDGEKVVILTARVHSSINKTQRRYTHKLIEAWCLKYLGKRLPITSEKSPLFKVMYDDRAIQVKNGKIIG